MAKSEIPGKTAGRDEIYRNLYTDLFSSLRDSILITNTDRQIIDCNPAFTELFGHTLDEIKGKDTSVIYKDIEEFRNMGKKIKDRMGDPGFLHIVQYRKKSGEIFPGETNVFYLTNSEGEIIGFIGLIRDITLRLKTERELYESRETFKTTLNSIGDGVITTDLTGKLSGMNPEAEKLTGWPATEAIGRSVYDIFRIFNALTGKPAENPVKKVLETGYVVGLANHTKLISKDGAELQIADSGAPIMSDNGKITGVVMVFRDVTEEYRIQEDLAKSEKRYRELVESVSAIVWEYSIKDDKWTYVSPQVEQLMGWKPEEWTNLAFWSNNLHPDDREEALSYCLACTGKGESHELEYRYRMKDGSYIWLRDVVTVEMEGNSPVLIRGFMFDITQRKIAEKELAEKTKYIETLLDNIPLGVSANFISSGEAFYMNRRFEEIYGWASEKLRDVNTFFEKVFPDKAYREQISGRILDDISSGDPSRMHWENIVITRSNGSTAHVNAINIPLPDMDIMISTVWDVTTEIDLIEMLKGAKDRAEESDRLKSSFLANVSHEIRTPMNGILGFTDLLKSPGLEGREKNQYLDIIQQSGFRLLDTIKDLVDISKIETDQTEVLIDETDINKQLTYFRDLFEMQAKSKGLEFRLLPLLPEDNAVIKTDKTKLESILSNLLKNALKFTMKGYIEFGAIHEEGFIKFVVKDTGIGIAPDKVDTIFEKFVQCETGSSRKYEGSGIGLSIVKAYTELLGGTVAVESEPGKGSTFILRLPLINYKYAGTKTGKSDKDVLQNGHSQKLNILIAEDEPYSYQYLSIVLRELAGEIFQAETGEKAVEICRERDDIDLVLMDIRMPVMDGYEATRRIREFNSKVPIIAQTAYVSVSEQEKSASAGCNAYISKPVAKNELIRLINQTLNKA